MKKSYALLVATDYSKCSSIAEEYAIQFAKRTNSNILFLHVFSSPLVIPLDTFELEKIDSNLIVQETERLKEHVSNLLKSLNINEKEFLHNYLIREGNIEKQIKQVVIESHIDLIFIGKQGSTGIKEVLFGSNAWRIIKTSQIPVLAIPTDSNKFTKIKRIVFATEYRAGEIPAINYLTNLADGLEAEVIVLHISNQEFSQEHERSIYDKFRKDIIRENHYKELDVHFMYNQDIIDGINKFCLRTKTDWLVMSPEKLSLLDKILNPSGSIAKKMSYNTNIPLLSIPDFYNPEDASFKKINEKGNKQH